MLAVPVLSPESVHHAQFEELGVIDGRRLHSAARGRMEDGAGGGGGWPSPSSAGFVYPSALASRSQSGCASLPPHPDVRRLESGDGRPTGLEGDKTVTSVELVMAGEGRLKFPPLLCIRSIAHVKGGTPARISSMTSSQTGIPPEREGRDEEPGWASGRVCDWTMNSWVFGSISLVSRVSLSIT